MPEHAPSGTKPPAPPPLRAFKVSKDGLYAGALGSGPGPFVSARSRDGSGTPLSSLRFTSSHFLLEREVMPQLEAARGLDDAVARLRAAGFVVEEVPYLELFDLPVDGPTPTEKERRAVQEDLGLPPRKR